MDASSRNARFSPDFAVVFGPAMPGLGLACALRAMASHQGFPTIQVLVGPDKESPQTRYDCGIRITSQAPKSDLYQTVPEVKEATDNVTGETANLKADMDDFLKAEQAFLSAKTKLGAGVVRFDHVLNVFVAVVEKHCTSEDDGAGLGVAIRKGTRSALAVPVKVEAKYNPRRDWIHIHVHKAPGTSSLRVEVSTDQVTWKELDGDGAIHTIPNPDPGTYWIRALSMNAREKSDYTSPMSVTVR